MVTQLCTNTTSQCVCAIAHAYVLHAWVSNCVYRKQSYNALNDAESVQQCIDICSSHVHRLCMHVLCICYVNATVQNIFQAFLMLLGNKLSELN